MLHSSETKKVVLIGAGHAHIQVIDSYARKPWRNVSMTLVNDFAETYYSGMLSGHLAGWYKKSEICFDLKELCRRAQIDFVEHAATQVDTLAQDLVLNSGERIDYDVLSFDVGSRPKVGVGFDLSSEKIISVKPVPLFLSRWANMLGQLWEWKSDRPAEVAIVGGGASGIELALVLAVRTANLARRPRITVWQTGREILAQHNGRVRRRVQAALKYWGVSLQRESEVLGLNSGGLKWKRRDGSQSGHELCDFAVIATHATAGSELFATSGFQIDALGFVKVDGALRVLDQSRIFAAGDCIHFSPQVLPKSGVYAVRQGPILTYNLKATCAGAKRLRRYLPQKTALALITLGDRRAVGAYGPLAVSGGWVWRLKDRIDREFMRRFQAQPTK